VATLQENAQRTLSDEQASILAETGQTPRQIFIGAAGTGKTYLAQEIARRLAAAGKKVFLTWYNKKEHDLFAELASVKNVTAKPFLSFLLEDMAYRGKSLEEPAAASEQQAFYDHILVNNAADVYENLPIEERFDAVIVDEGQEFRAHWHGCLSAMLKPDGQFHAFADPEQNFFADGEPGLITKLPASPLRLSGNYRNTRVINEFLAGLRKQSATSLIDIPDQKVTLLPWQVAMDQAAVLDQALTALKRQGFDLSRVVILSPFRKEKGALAGIQSLAGLQVKESPVPIANAIAYSTIRAYKGLEADVVFVIDIKPGSPLCLPADVYVAASRAKHQLSILHRSDWQLPALAEVD
jgi:superfamily I DNA/RNA helicase